MKIKVEKLVEQMELTKMSLSDLPPETFLLVASKMNLYDRIRFMSITQKAHKLHLSLIPTLEKIFWDQLEPLVKKFDNNAPKRETISFACSIMKTLMFCFEYLHLERDENVEFIRVVLGRFKKFSEDKLGCELICVKYQSLYDDLIAMLPENERIGYAMDFSNLPLFNGRLVNFSDIQAA